MNNKISKESYDRLSKILGKPEEYLDGKVCTYDVLDCIDAHFLHNLDKETLSDYFFISDWKKFSFYNGSLLKKILEHTLYKNIPLENITLIWNAFNENKKELQGDSASYYEDKRYQHIPDIALLLLKQSKNYQTEKLIPLLKEICNEYKTLIMQINKTDSKDSSQYYYARFTAKMLGEYIENNRELNEDIFQYLKSEQIIDKLDLNLIFHDWNIAKIYRIEKLEKIFDLMKEKHPEIENKEIINEAIRRNAFQLIKYIEIHEDYLFDESELIQILQHKKNAFNKEEVQYIIENFKPANIVEKAVSIVYSDYKYSFKDEEKEYYNSIIQYLKKKNKYDELNDKLEMKNTKIKITKI